MSTIDIDWFITRQEEVTALNNRLLDALEGQELFRNRKGEVFVGIGETRKPLQALLEEVDPHCRLHYNLIGQSADPFEYSDELRGMAEELGIDLTPVIPTQIWIQLRIGAVVMKP